MLFVIPWAHDVAVVVVCYLEMQFKNIFMCRRRRRISMGKGVDERGRSEEGAEGVLNVARQRVVLFWGVLGCQQQKVQKVDEEDDEEEEEE